MSRVIGSDALLPYTLLHLRSGIREKKNIVSQRPDETSFFHAHDALTVHIPIFSRAKVESKHRAVGGVPTKRNAFFVFSRSFLTGFQWFFVPIGGKSAILVTPIRLATGSIADFPP